MISCTMLTFLASSCATNAKASLIFSKAHSVSTHFSSESIFIFFPISIFQAVKAFFILLPRTLYSCLLFFVSQLSKPLYSVSFLEKVFLHLPYIVLFPSFSKSFHGTPSFPPPASIAHLTMVFSFCLQGFVETLLAQVGRVFFITFMNHHRRQLSVADRLLAALLATAKQHFMRDPNRTWYECNLINYRWLLLRLTTSFAAAAAFFESCQGTAELLPLLPDTQYFATHRASFLAQLPLLLGVPTNAFCLPRDGPSSSLKIFWPLLVEFFFQRSSTQSVALPVPHLPLSFI